MSTACFQFCECEDGLMLSSATAYIFSRDSPVLYQSKLSQNFSYPPHSTLNPLRAGFFAECGPLLPVSGPLRTKPRFAFSTCHRRLWNSSVLTDMTRRGRGRRCLRSKKVARPLRPWWGGRGSLRGCTGSSPGWRSFSGLAVARVFWVVGMIGFRLARNSEAIRLRMKLIIRWC